MSKSQFLNPVTLESVIEKVRKYHSTMNDVADLIDKSGPSNLKIDKEHAFLQYYISKEAFDNLIFISNQENFDGFVVFFGMEDESKYNKLTAIIMGANSQQNILNQHKEVFEIKPGVFNNPIPVDEQNPPPPYSNGLNNEVPANCFTLKSKWEDVESFFKNPDPNQKIEPKKNN